METLFFHFFFIFIFLTLSSIPILLEGTVEVVSRRLQLANLPSLIHRPYVQCLGWLWESSGELQGASVNFRATCCRHFSLMNLQSLMRHV